MYELDRKALSVMVLPFALFIFAALGCVQGDLAIDATLPVSFPLFAYTVQFRAAQAVNVQFEFPSQANLVLRLMPVASWRGSRELRAG